MSVARTPLTDAQHKQLIVAAAMDLLELRWALENIAIVLNVQPEDLQASIDATVAATDQRSRHQQRTN